MRVYVLDSESLNPYRNLAYENALLQYISDLGRKGQPAAALFFWQNDKTVVIGKHQNPYKECNLEYMRGQGIKLARRTTGGGAVYHDTGNVNFTFAATHPIYDKQRNLQILLIALNSLGIGAELSGRNDILLDGKKFSGNAFKNGKYASLHHGTILIDLASEEANKSLTPDKYKLMKKGVDSVKSRIINLKSKYKDIDRKTVSDAIKQSFLDSFSDCEMFFELPLATKELYKTYSSKQWIFGGYKDCDYTVCGNFAWGSIGIDLSLAAGRIDRIKIATDSLATYGFGETESLLKGLEFTRESLQNCYTAVLDNPMQQDIINLLLQYVTE